jgi:hypothetical protein
MGSSSDIRIQSNDQEAPQYGEGSIHMDTSPSISWGLSMCFVVDVTSASRELSARVEQVTGPWCSEQP